jgi:hypothetical protein
MSNSRRYRVYRIPESLRKAVKTKVQSSGTNAKAVLDGAVSDGLPKVVAALQAVGFTMAKGKVRPIRWPVDSELLGALRVASKQTGGISASKLLAVSLALFCAEPVKTPRKKTKKVSASRMWKCPECGREETVDQDWLADHGEPVCPVCDCDMKLEAERIKK